MARRVVLVVGPGRNGTTELGRTLEALGLHDESRRAAVLHDELLERCHVQVADARPSAWFETGKASTSGITRTRLTEWLGPVFREASQDVPAVEEILVDDPRLVWFLGLWKAAALRCDAAATYATVLRHPAEVVGSGRPDDATSSTAGWVNVMLHAERATRGDTRCFVRYDDLVGDWTVPVFRLGQQLGLRTVQEASANAMRQAHQAVDPTLDDARTSWDDLTVSQPVRDLAETAWQGLARLADPDGDTPDVHARLDEVRAAYVATYAQAESLARSSVEAARAEGATLGRPRVRDLVPDSAKRRLRPVLGPLLGRTLGR